MVLNQIKRGGVVAAISSIAMLASLAACGNSSSASASKTADGKTIIKIQTFNNFGYGKPTNERPGADLWAQYEKLNPNVKVEEIVAATSDDARSAFNTAISSGSNAYDVYAVDINWMPSITSMPDKFMDQTKYLKDNDWLDWKVEAGKTSDGKMIGASNDIGPSAVCYRRDLFEKAGLPSDRAEVAKLLGGDSATWDQYFQVGKEYTDKTGLPWYDSMGGTWAAMRTQNKETYVKEDGTVIATDDALKKQFMDLTATTDQSAHLNQWSDDWNAQFKSDKGFATMICPAWIVNNIKGNAGEDFKGWDIADVTPGGGVNEGGSYLVIPESSPVKEEAAKLVAWLTNAKQQVSVFTAASNFPSSPTALADEKVTSKTDSFLNDAPTGQIFANRAKAITVDPYIGGQHFDVDAKFQDAITRVDVNKEQSPEQSWKQFVQDVKALS